jgi:hypothetical protein
VLFAGDYLIGIIRLSQPRETGNETGVRREDANCNELCTGAGLLARTSIYTEFQQPRLYLAADWGAAGRRRHVDCLAAEAALVLDGCASKGPGFKTPGNNIISIRCTEQFKRGTK